MNTYVSAGNQVGTKGSWIEVGGSWFEKSYFSGGQARSGGQVPAPIARSSSAAASPWTRSGFEPVDSAVCS